MCVCLRVCPLDEHPSPPQFLPNSVFPPRNPLKQSGWAVLAPAAISARPAALTVTTLHHTCGPGVPLPPSPPARYGTASAVARLTRAERGAERGAQRTALVNERTHDSSDPPSSFLAQWLFQSTSLILTSMARSPSAAASTLQDNVPILPVAQGFSGGSPALPPPTHLSCYHPASRAQPPST